MIFSPNKGSNLDIHFTIAGNEIEYRFLYSRFWVSELIINYHYKDHGKHVISKLTSVNFVLFKSIFYLDQYYDCCLMHQEYLI